MGHQHTYRDWKKDDNHSACKEYKQKTSKCFFQMRQSNSYNPQLVSLCFLHRRQITFQPACKVVQAAGGERGSCPPTLLF